MRPPQIDRTQGPCNFVACARGPKDTASLEHATKLPNPKNGRAFVKVYAKCGEAVVYPVTSHRKCDRSRKPGGAKDPERTAEVALRRARKIIRQFAKEFRLRYMWTLTYAGTGEFDIEQVRRHVERLIKALVNEQGERFPYVWVPELHPGGHGIHIHMAVPFYIEHEKLMKLWGRGIVDLRDKKPKGAAAAFGGQVAGGYLSKYLGKAFDETAFGKHRYERAQGFDITSYRVRRYDMADGVEYAMQIFGCSPVFQWSSADQDGWTGPPIEVMFFNCEPPDG